MRSGDGGSRVKQEAGKKEETLGVQFRKFMRRYSRNLGALVGLIVLLSVLVLAIFAPYVAPHDPYEQDWTNRLSSPSRDNLFGTDQHGRDLFSRILFGSRLALSIGLISIAIGVVIGGFLGLISGYYGGRLDHVIMRVIDVLMAFPGILLALAVVAALGPGLYNVMIAVGIWSIPLFSRTIRGTVLSIKEQDYIESARSLGAGDMSIIVRHILPNAMAPILVLSTLRLATALLSAAGLSFLGLGAQPPMPDWGAMLSSGREHLETSPHLSIFPGLAIMLLVLSFNMVGDGLRDALDPRLKQ